MLTVKFINEPDFELLSQHGFDFICDDDMNYKMDFDEFYKMLDKFPLLNSDIADVYNDDDDDLAF